MDEKKYYSDIDNGNLNPDTGCGDIGRMDFERIECPEESPEQIGLIEHHKEPAEQNKRLLQMYFSVIYRHGRVMHDKAMKQFGLTGQQMGYLKEIGSNPGLSQEELAREMHIDKGAVAKSLKVLVRKGYVTRKRNPADMRAYCLFPTEAAADIHEMGEKYSIEFEHEITRGLTDGERETLKRLLGIVTKNIAEMLERGDI